MVLFSFCFAIVLAVAACGGGGNDPSPSPGNVTNGGATIPSPNDIPGDVAAVAPRTATGFMPLSTLPANAEGEITVLAGGNHGMFWDIGNNRPEFTVSNWGALLRYYEAAKEFKKLYPNIKINVMSVNFYKNTDEVSFSQGLLNAREDFGILPDMWETHDLVLHVLQGEASNLSRFQNEESFQIFNPTLMELMNYYGAQMGLPGWFTSWAVGINIDLAESLNIDVPPFNWNMNQYADYIANADMVTVLGDIWNPSFFINMGARDISYSAVNYGYVNFDTAEVRRLIDLQHRWDRYQMWSNFTSPPVEAMLDAHWWDPGRLFANNLSLASNYAGWQFGAFANPNNRNMYMPGRWDLWPIPGSNDMGPSLSTVFDPVVIRNFAGQPNADHQLDITYAFAAFLYGSLEGTRARHAPGIEAVDDDGNLVFQHANHDSWPVVRAPYFELHMEIWYESQPDIFRTLPGLQNLFRMLQDGQISGMDARTFPGKYVEDGVIRNAFEEWNNRSESDERGVGVPISDPAWPDRVKARLAEWTTLTNHRLQLADQSIREALSRHYGITNFPPPQRNMLLE
jgi:ABC-type glycerol-3-phosphate transport system substrate-binding protein